MTEVLDEIEIEESSGFVLAFEDNIESDSLCVSFKINVVMEDDQTSFEDYQLCRNVNQFMLDHTNKGRDIVAQTQGLHINGKRQKPHIHLHYIINNSIEFNDMRSNASQARKRYWKKQEWLNYPTEKGKLEMKVQPLEPLKSKYAFLAYPLKEKLYYKEKKYFQFMNDSMTKEMIEFLLEYANGIYELALAKNHTNDLSEQRKDLAWQEILAVARKYSGDHDYLSFQKFIYNEYLKPYMKENKNCPDVTNYNKNVRRAGVYLEIIFPWEC